MSTKSLQTTTAAFGLAAPLATNTLAPVTFDQYRINEFGRSPRTGGTTHDDFDEPNKDVYIENWGFEPLFVRIRLDEYMEIGEGAGNKADSGLINNATSLIATADINNPKTWQPHVLCGAAEPYTKQFCEYWNWQMGGYKYYMPADKSTHNNPTFIAQDSLIYSGGEPCVKKTLDATVIAMEQWINEGRKPGPYWVVDIDGWAYWAQALAPGDATGLLLDTVILIDAPSEPYYYAINVTAQMGAETGEKSYLDFGTPGSTDVNSHMTLNGSTLLDKAASRGSGFTLGQ